MKNLIAAAAVAASLAAVAMPAAAATDVSLGYTGIDANSVNLSGVTGRASWNSGIFGVEAEATVGTGDDTVGATKVELDSQWAVYGTARAPVSENFDVFARVGYGSTRVKATPGGSAHDESWNYGVGGQYFFDGANGVRVEYTRNNFDNKSAFSDLDTYSVSYVHRFR